MSYYKVGLDMDVRVIGPGRVSIGAVQPLTAVESTRAEAQAAAMGPSNKNKKYFGYGRLVAQADIAPEDQVIIKNSDSLEDMQKWVATASADPQMVWAGFFDNTTHKLVQQSVGEAIVVTPAAPQKQGSHLGLVLGLIGAGLAGMVAFKPRHKAVI